MPEKVRSIAPAYRPSKRQLLFHHSKAFETLYGGAAGGGKTAALCAEAIRMCFTHPGIRIYYFRRTFPELESTAVVEIQKQAAEFIDAGLVKYNSQKHLFEFIVRSEDGKTQTSIVQLAYCEQPGDVYRYQSAEYQILMIDELTHFKEEIYDYLKTRVRSSNSSLPQRVMCATNPGNIGHGWVKRRFIEDFPPEEIYRDQELYGRLVSKEGIPEDVALYKSTRMFVPAKVSDHPDPDFVASYTAGLEGQVNEETKRALLEGDWDLFSGQAFTEFKRTHNGQPWHVVSPAEVRIESWWPRWMSYDWGYGDFAAALWFAKDPHTKRIYIYREMYPKKMVISDQASTILSYDRNEDMRQRLADPSLWKHIANADTGETMAQIFAKNKVYFTPANNNRHSGKMAVHQILAPAEDGLPGVQIFQNCVNLIRTLPELPYDEHDAEDVDTDAEDHLYDALRYGIMNQVNTSSRKPKKARTYDAITGRRL